jgi:hypothetical protein
VQLRTAPPASVSKLACAQESLEFFSKTSSNGLAAIRLVPSGEGSMRFGKMSGARPRYCCRNSSSARWPSSAAAFG